MRNINIHDDKPRRDTLMKFMIRLWFNKYHRLLLFVIYNILTRTHATQSRPSDYNSFYFLHRSVLRFCVRWIIIAAILFRRDIYNIIILTARKARTTAFLHIRKVNPGYRLFLFGYIYSMITPRCYKRFVTQRNLVETVPPWVERAACEQTFLTGPKWIECALFLSRTHEYQSKLRPNLFVDFQGLAHWEL